MFKNIYVSKGLEFFSNQILLTHPQLNLKYNSDEPCIFFGIYFKEDLNILLNHKSYGLIIWGGSDSMYTNNIKIISKLDPTRFFSIAQSKWVSEDLTKYQIAHKQLPWYSLNKKLFNPTQKGECVYMYMPSRNINFYGKEILDKLKNKIKYDIIIGDGNIPYEKMTEVYSKCFIGLRLVNHDGLGSTVQELGLMGIKCVHNGDSPSALNYNTVEDIIEHINIEAKNIGKIDNELALKVDKYLNIDDDFFKISTYFKDTCVFKNENNVEIKLITHPFTRLFKIRDNHEVMFRRIHSYLIKNNIINGNIIDLGAWIGDNSIPWAKQTNHIIYAIDPSPNNINFINKMIEKNNIRNIITIEKGISDKIETLSTNQNIDHCSFKSNEGNNKVEMVSLDYLYTNNEIKNIDYIHLDVEGLEFKVIKGASNLINESRPIITFEQHINSEDYISLSNYLINKHYNVYLINEILPGCREDCRNLIAFPKERNIDVGIIHEYLNDVVLLSIGHENMYQSEFTATIYGEHMSGKEYVNVFSIKYNDLYLFPVHDNNYTKIVAINQEKEWVSGKYLMGNIYLNSPKSVINAYRSCYGNVNKEQYNIKNITRIK